MEMKVHKDLFLCRTKFRLPSTQNAALNSCNTLVLSEQPFKGQQAVIFTREKSKKNSGM